MSEREELLERRLRTALERVNAPAGFAERVLARAEAERGAAGQVRGGWWRAVAAAFLLGALSGGWLMHHERVEQREAMAAAEQFRTAMRVTARVTQRSMAEAGRKINRDDEERRDAE